MFKKHKRRSNEYDQQTWCKTLLKYLVTFFADHKEIKKLPCNKLLLFTYKHFLLKMKQNLFTQKKNKNDGID